MKKIMFLTVAALLFLMPPAIAQDEDGEAGADAAESADEKSAEPTADGEKTAAGAEGKKEKAGAAETEKKTIFSEHHQKIKSLREKWEKLENAGRSREANRTLDTLKSAQKKLKYHFEKEADKLRTAIAHLKERSRIGRGAAKSKAEAELKQKEEELKTLTEDAGLETWCSERKEPARGKDKNASKDKSKRSKSKIVRKGKKK